MFKCPYCGSGLSKSILNDEKPVCQGCTHSFSRTNGFLSFIEMDASNCEFSGVESDLDFLEHEDYTTRARFRRYFVPLLKGEGLGRDSRILCLGCGGGTDVDELQKNGFHKTFGIDISWRCQWWETHDGDPEALFVADGRSLPFEEQYFDVIISLGVIEHVGAIGGTGDLYQDYEEERNRFVAEALRVMKKEGKLILACPNRTFLVDFQHNISRKKFFKQLAIKTGISVHSPFDRFLLSYGDVINHARSVSPDIGIFPLPLYNYLGLAFRNSPMLRPLSAFFKSYFLVLDMLPAFIRMSFINPYMVCILSNKFPSKRGK